MKATIIVILLSAIACSLPQELTLLHKQILTTQNVQVTIFPANGANNVNRDTHLVLTFPNNPAFNPAKSGPSRRPVFTLNECQYIPLSTFTIGNYFIGQAEALLVRGQRIIIDRMDLIGSSDVSTTYGTIYFFDSTLSGHGDTVLGYGAV